MGHTLGMPSRIDPHLDPCTSRWMAEAQEGEPGIWAALCEPSDTWFHRPTIGMADPAAVPSSDDMLGRDELDGASFTRNAIWGDALHSVTRAGIIGALKVRSANDSGDLDELLSRGELFPGSMARPSATFASMVGQARAIPLERPTSAAELMLDLIGEALSEISWRQGLYPELAGLLPGLRHSLAAGLSQAGRNDHAPAIGWTEQGGLLGAMAWDAALPLVIGQGWNPWGGRTTSGQEALIRMAAWLLEAGRRPKDRARAAAALMRASLDEGHSLLDLPEDEEGGKAAFEAWLEQAEELAQRGQVIPALIGESLREPGWRIDQQRHAALSACAWGPDLLICLSSRPDLRPPHAPDLRTATLLRVAT